MSGRAVIALRARQLLAADPAMAPLTQVLAELEFEPGGMDTADVRRPRARRA